MKGEEFKQIAIRIILLIVSVIFFLAYYSLILTQPELNEGSNSTSIFQSMREIFDGMMKDDAYCSICGPLKRVGNVDAIFAFPGQPNQTCGEFETNGFEGSLTSSECQDFPALTQDICSCRATTAACSICGERKEVTNPNGIFYFPGQPSTTCRQLEENGKSGAIDDCQFLPTLVNSLCDCQPIVPQEQCSVCGDGKRVTNPEGIFAFPAQPTISCRDLEIAGEEGNNDDVIDQCTLLPVLIGSLCDCQPIPPSVSAPPVATRPPTPAPSIASRQPTRTKIPTTRLPLSSPPSPNPTTGNPTSKAPIITSPPTLKLTSAPSITPPTPTLKPTSTPTRDFFRFPSQSSSPMTATSSPIPVVTLKPTTTAPTPKPSPSSINEDVDFESFLMNETPDDAFYMVELLYYKTRRPETATEFYYMNSSIFPAEQVVSHGTILGNKHFYVVKYTSGTSYRNKILQNQTVQTAYDAYHATYLTHYYTWATKLMTTAVPSVLTQPPMDTIPFYQDGVTQQTLFFHALSFLESAVSLSPPRTGREGMDVFDQLISPLKADYGIRAVGWFDVRVTVASGIVNTNNDDSTTTTATRMQPIYNSTYTAMSEIRIELIPSLVGLGDIMQNTTWIEAATYREAAITDDSITYFAKPKVNINQYRTTTRTSSEDDEIQI